MKVQVIEDTKVLLPHPEHQNFVEGKETIPAQTILNGEPKVVAGLRRGEPFNYKLFLTNDNKLIYIKNLRNMDATEVTLGADGETSPTVVNLKQTVLARPGIMGAGIGAIVGFGYSKYKKHQEGKKVILSVLAGAIIGYMAGHIIAHKVTIKPSK